MRGLKKKITEVCFNSGRTALLLGFDANNALLSEAISVCDDYRHCVPSASKENVCV